MSKDHEYLYPYSAQEAKKRNQLPMWRESYHANVACRNAIEETIRQNFNGMNLKKDCLEPVLAEYGYKRTEWVLATTLQELSWDGRFSRANKQWAARRYIPQDERHNAEITVRSHPAILDGFVDLYREAYQMISQMQHQICDSPIIADNMRQLVQALETTTGKKQYGYLKKPLKQLVDTIVDALAELPEVSECYKVWNQIHKELNECYGHSTPWEQLPLSQRKEFRKIKNDIIREAENIRLGLPTFEDERMQDEPEPESQKEEHQSYSVYEQAQRYRAAKAVLQDIYALDAEHTEAVKALEQLWEEGYTVAAHQLGKFYRDDLSTLRDHKKAEQWFRCSAEAGNDFSKYALGKLLLTQKRTVEALEWLDKAAEQGNQFARYRLGKTYLTGEPVPKDVEKALAYLTASANQGNQFAQYTLGKLYLLGRDVPPDREQAKEWLIRAAAQGNEYARFFLDRFDQFRDPSVMLAATKLLHHMSRIFQSNSVPPSNPAGIRIDSKRRRRLMEKRMAMGHRADDHEEQTQYQQSM